MNATLFCLRLCGGLALLCLLANSGVHARCHNEMLVSLSQLDPAQQSSQVYAALLQEHSYRQWDSVIPGIAWFCLLSAVIGEAFASMWRGRRAIALALLLLPTTGCWRPFEPVKLEIIQPNEEAFLLPLLGDIERQTSTNTEEYLRMSLVYSQQVKIPQQWVPRGYETVVPNGEWRDAALLVRVNKSPVTREWTADPNSGTSSRNEAIWVMTSDQVEFSTGWTCTARIASREAAVKFLHNYPNGSLTTVMDQEVRAKLQSKFGIEVTDLPMEVLRLKATPHLTEVVDHVVKFFAERGISITNLGISGGFVYKDPSIMKTMVEVFNGEQKKAIAMADTAAQVEKNKTIQLEGDARAKAILTERQAEADGIRLVADANHYEIQQAAEDSSVYMQLKQMELERLRFEKWDGRLPTYFVSDEQPMNLLLPSPSLSR